MCLVSCPKYYCIAGAKRGSGLGALALGQEMKECLQTLKAVPPVLLAQAGSPSTLKRSRFLPPEELAVWRDVSKEVLRPWGLSN